MKLNLKSIALTIGLAIIAVTKVSDAADAADYYVRSLPGLPDSVYLKSHAGHITIDEQTQSNIFFWLMHNLHIAESGKLIIWLNGGPGCSSMDGVFLENGPFRMNKNQTLEPSYGSWNEYANVLYVDQPVGTGFSFTNSYISNITQVPQQFLTFLDKFFEIFPEYSKDDMYLAGESYAGVFIPYIADGILKREDKKYNLRGIAIGNGWIDPPPQYRSYYDFSVANNILDGEYKKLTNHQLEICEEVLKGPAVIKYDECEKILSVILDGTRKRIGKVETCINQYDIRDHSDSWPYCGLKWPYELATVNEYLHRPDVVAAIHATKKPGWWVECDSTVSDHLNDDKSPPPITLFPEILKKINVLLYSGDQDIICNYMGTEAMINNLEWNGYKGFQNNTKLHWYVNNTLAGHVVTERNLTYIKVFNASHMVPYDAPVVSMDMMYRFMGLDHHIVNKFPSRIESEGFEDVKKNLSSEHEDEKEVWNRYYNAGTTTLIIVIIGVTGLAAFVFRGKIMRKFSRIKQTMKVNTEETNEMDNLVIETQLYNSGDLDHFGDSDADDDIQESNHNRQREKYRDEEK